MHGLININGYVYGLPKVTVYDINGKLKYPAGGGGAVWGSITGTITAQTDLISYLSGNYVPLTRNITINGVTQDLSVDRTWTIAGGGTVTSVQLAPGTGISLSGTNPIITSGIITVTNSAPDQTVVLTPGTGIGITGTYPSFTITNNSPFTSPLTTKGDVYVRDGSADTRLPVGLDTQVLIADSTASTGLKWGSNTAPTPTGYYGAFYDLTNQTAAVDNTPYAMVYGTTDLSNGVSIVSSSRITIANTGVYNIQFSAQIQNTDNVPHDVTIWFRKNGTDIPDSSTIVGLEQRKSVGDPYHTVAAWNFVVDAVGGDYYQIMWATDNHTNISIPTYVATAYSPVVPSVIVTVTQQSGIMAGTGITAINSLTGAVQTLAVGTTGTDFGISSSGTVHTFDLPTASATNRGALSSTDWSTFNDKAPTASPAFTGNPTAPTPSFGDNDTSIATTAFVQAALNTPSLIKVNGNLTTAVNSTSLTTLYSFYIPANTVAAGDMIYVVGRARKSPIAANGNASLRIYVNTSATAGGSIVGVLTTSVANNVFMQLKREISITNATNSSIVFINTTSAGNDDGATNGASNVLVIDWTVDQYIVLGITPVSATDTWYGAGFRAEIKKYNP